MMTRKRAWHALSYCIAAALLAGCGGSQSPTGTPGAMPQLPAVSPNSIMAHSGATSSSYQIVYRFAGGTDGQKPQASLIDVNGTLYGTTTTGGAYCQRKRRCGVRHRLQRRDDRHGERAAQFWKWHRWHSANVQFDRRQRHALRHNRVWWRILRGRRSYGLRNRL